MQIVLQAMAKVNLSLHITGILENGYHSLEMVMQSIDLHDTITIQTREDDGIILACDHDGIPTGSENIAYKAAQLFFKETEQSFGVSIDIQKRIPHQAGLGGGSADAAAVLVALNALSGLHLHTDKLCDIGLQVGADVPFCIKGGTCLVQGIGEQIYPLVPLQEYTLVLVKPDFGVSTKEAYQKYDALGVQRKADTSRLVKAILTDDFSGLCRHLENVLELVVDRPEISQIKEELLSLGAAGSLMSGSGSAVFGLFQEAETAKACYRELQSKYTNVYLCKFSPVGIKIQ